MVGVLALAILYVGTITLGIISFRRARLPEDRHLCACLVAAQFMAVVVSGTFDSFEFSTFLMTLSLLIGLTAAMWRFTRPTGQGPSGPARTLEQSTPGQAVVYRSTTAS
jgi:hypothetical protein